MAEATQEASLRQRSAAATEEPSTGADSKASAAKGNSKGATAQALVETAAPEWLKPYAKKIGGLVGNLGEFADKAAPHVEKVIVHAKALYKKIEPYNPEDLAPMFVGVILMFFGGHFVTSIACWEAFRIGGWRQFKDNFTSLMQDYEKVREASKKDDELDEDGNGIPDVNEIDKKTLVSRKIRLIFRTCDPSKVSSALNGIYSGFVAVVATLRVQFARTVALGATIGEIIHKPLSRHVAPALEAAVPVEYRKWVPIALGYLCKTIGVTIAWSLHRLVAAFHSALRGAQIFVEALGDLAKKHGHPELTKGYADEALAGVLAVAGCWFQIRYWFSLPWILWLPLLPAILLEKILTLVVGVAA